MNIFNQFNKKNNQLNDDVIYDYISDEINNNIIIQGLWTRALAHSEGNEAKTQSLYIQYRFKDIKNYFHSLNININTFDKHEINKFFKYKIYKKESISNFSEKDIFFSEEKEIRNNIDNNINEKVKFQKSKEKLIDLKKGKFKGWLLFFAIILIVNIIGSFKSLEVLTSNDYKNSIEALYLFKFYDVVYKFDLIFYFEMIYLFIFFLFSWIFFRKLKLIYNMFNILLLSKIIFVSISIYLMLEISNMINSFIFTKEILIQIYGIVFLIIFYSYFKFSKRVKYVFTKNEDIKLLIIKAAIMPLIFSFVYFNSYKKPSEYELANKSFEKGKYYYSLNDLGNSETYFNLSTEHLFSMSKNIGDYFYEKKSYSQAKNWYIKYLTVTKDYTNNDVIFNLAYSYHQSLNFENAITWYKKYLEIDSSETSVLWNLGIIYENIFKDINKAMIYYQKAADLNFKEAIKKIDDYYYVEFKPKVFPVDAKIEILNPKLEYSFGKKLKKGKYLIRISKNGYYTYLNEVSINNDTDLNVSLFKSINNMAYKVENSRFENWFDANLRCKQIGVNWRLAGIDELSYLNKFTNELNGYSYWSIESNQDKTYYRFYDSKLNQQGFHTPNNYHFSVCIFRK